jgi:hypothetical protein
MMERRKSPRKDWAIGKDETGRAVLEWKVDSRRTERQESDPCARTYDFLKRLEVPDLELEDDPARRSAARGCNPYDHGLPPRSKQGSRH